MSDLLKQLSKEQSEAIKKESERAEGFCRGINHCPFCYGCSKADQYFSISSETHPNLFPELQSMSSKVSTRVDTPAQRNKLLKAGYSIDNLNAIFFIDTHPNMEIN